MDQLNFKNIIERDEVIKEIKNLRTLNKIEEKVSNFARKYDKFYQDFNIILICIKENLPYDVIDFLLSKHNGDFNVYNKDAYPLYILLTEKKYKFVELLLKYGFSINANIKFDKINEKCNLFFGLLINNKLDDENIKFLITHGIDIHSKFKMKDKLDNKSEKSRMIDVLVSKSFNSNKKVIYPYYECLKFLFNYYSTINNKPIIYFIFLGKNKLKIETQMFKSLLENSIKFVNLDDLPERILKKIIQSKALKVINLFISYIGKEKFKNSKFFENLKTISTSLGEEEFPNSIVQNFLSGNDDIKNKIKKSFFKSIKENNVAIIKDILHTHKEIINTRNKEEKTPLIYAAQHCTGKPEVIDILIKNEANKDDVDITKSTALHIACQYDNYNSVPKLITEKNINSVNEYGLTPLMIAIMRNHYMCVFALLSNNYNIDIVNVTDNKNNTPLTYMIKNNMGFESMYELLIDKHAYIDYKQFKNELNPYIIQNKCFINAIINKGIYLLIDGRINCIKYPLILSIKEGMLGLFKKLLKYSKFINKFDENKKPCLFYALENNNEEYFNFLINSGKINVEDCDGTGKTPIEYSIELNKEKMTKLLLFQYVDIILNKYKANLKNIINSKFTAINSELSKQTKLNYSKIKDTLNLFKDQVESKNKDTFRSEISRENQNLHENKNISKNEGVYKNENISQKNYKKHQVEEDNDFSENYPIKDPKMDEYDVLFKACSLGNYGIIESLIKSKIYNINTTIGEFKFTPLMTLIYYEHYSCVDLLIKYNANVNIKDINGNSPLTYMLKYSKINKNIYELLINNGAYIEYNLFKNEKFLEKILENNVKVEACNENNVTPIKYACRLGNEEIIEMLIKQIVNLNENYQNNSYYNLILQEMEYKNFFLVDYIINNSIEKPDEHINLIKKFVKTPILSNRLKFRNINDRYNSLDQEYKRYSKETISFSKSNINISNTPYSLSNQNNFDTDEDEVSEINNSNNNVEEFGVRLSDKQDNRKRESNTKIKENKKLANLVFLSINNLDYEAAVILIERYNCINNENNEGFNILTYIILNKDKYDEKFFKYLINHGAYINKNIFKKEWKDSLEIMSNEKFINYLLKEKLKFKFKKNEEPKTMTFILLLHYLIKYKNSKYLKKILDSNKKRKNPNSIINEENPSLVEEITKEKNYEILEILLEYIDPKMKINNKTLLMFAAENKDNHKNEYDNQKSLNIIKLLLSKGIDINEKDNNNETALFYAVKCKNEKIMIQLVDEGADIQIKNNKNENILFTAVRTNKNSIVNYLLPKIKDKQLINNEKHNVTYYAKNNKIKDLLHQNGIK
ncbi:ankyrin [Neocallimastix lanati (nom. inval.)]|uniref:Ankyrin n=1 Tax=Neocallimastix californiae TaxID=1754190 RepID=A0A1Y2EZX8_9FUNG|nr:ankyrin [Neocallimastix sp. JGI-2020a]ORY77130.1 ankyrin [Neocallimastix californiae]|eukprot:ORY77130.1 ankyrin [Neocallimastix californiae]